MGCTGPVDPEDPPSFVIGRGGGEVREGGCLGKAGGAFPPGVGFAWLLARACGGGDLAGNTFTEGGPSLATLLLMNVVGSLWRFLCCLQ